MNLQFYFKSFFVAICLLLSFNLSAQTSLSVNTTSAGTLSSKLGSSANTIVNLTVAGDINYTDLATIKGMSGLKSLDISNTSVKACSVDGVDYLDNELPAGIFTYKTLLSSCILPNSITAINSFAFYFCTGLKSVAIPNSVTSINSSAFQGCSGLTTVTIGDNVTLIGSNAFFNCTGLTSVSIGSNVVSIGLDAFSGCTNLNEINVSASNSSYAGVDGVLFNKGKAEMMLFPTVKSSMEYTTPASATSIGINAFKNSKALSSVVINNNVTSIGLGAFDGSATLSALTIGSRVSSIGNYALSCAGLKKITCKSATPPTTSSYTFDKLDRTTCKLYVPKGSVSTYKAAAGWSGFSSIVEEALTSTGISENVAGKTAVYSDRDAIIVNGANSGETISVYTTVGALMQTAKVTANETRIENLPSNQIYLVKIAGTTFKVAL